MHYLRKELKIFGMELEILHILGGGKLVLIMVDKLEKEIEDFFVSLVYLLYIMKILQQLVLL